MKMIIKFSKVFIPLITLSVLIIASGLVVAFTRGINLGIDFKPGMIQEVCIAPTAATVTYSGFASISVQMNAQGVDFVVSGVGAENTTHSFPYSQYQTLGDLVAAFNTIDGITALAIAPESTPSTGLLVNSEVSSVLSNTPFAFHRVQADQKEITTDEIRSALAELPGANVKLLGDPRDRTFQIRVSDDGSDPAISATIKKNIASSLSAAFGSENIAILKTDFIGAQFSKTLVSQVVILVALTLLIILVYATVRFKWDFALGAVFAIIHDALIMFAFIAWTRMEFSSITIAAILTIIGYSINDTIVVLDRVRENIRNPNIKVKRFVEILDLSQSEILSRTIITTVTTMLAVISLYVFTSGSMKDFALALLVGMTSGVYSTIYVASAFIALVRRKWKPSDEEKKKEALSIVT